MTFVKDGINFMGMAVIPALHPQLSRAEVSDTLPMSQIWPSLFLYMKFYWNTSMSLYFHRVYGCFHITMAQPSSCNRDGHKAGNYFLSGPFQKKLANP